MEGWNGGRGSARSGYRRDTVGSNTSSSRSGTIVSGRSTPYTSGGSRFSTFSMETAMHFHSLGIYDWEEAEEEETGEGRIRGLVQEFFSAPAPNCSIKHGDTSVVKRWLKELGVGWILSLDGGAAVGEEFSCDARSWIQALHQVAVFRPLFSEDRGYMEPYLIDFLFEEEHVSERCVPDQYHLVLFIQQAMLKILTFVDVLVAWDPDTSGEFYSMNLIKLPLYAKLFNLLLVHDALFEASNKILTLFDSPTTVEAKRIENEIAILLSAYKSKVSEAIRCTLEKVKVMLMQIGDDSSSSLNPQGSSEIHKVTQFVLTYIDFLFCKSRLVNQVMQGHVPCTENIRPLDNMIVEMVSSLQEKLVNISESFSDQGLKLLFLLNNSYYIHWSLQSCRLPGPKLLHVDLEHKIKGYMEKYLQVSWAPLLCNSTPLCLGKKYFLLTKFGSEFQKIYTTQMEWKVPDPWMRGWLRQAISDKIIPGYTEYIEDNKVTRPKISPQELKAKLQELFEG